MGLDNIDRKILFELDTNCRIPETRLAKLVGKSKESVRYRLKNLRADGIILGYTTFINVSKIGYQGYKIYLKIKGKPERKKEFFEHIKTRTDIFWLGSADGAWDTGLTFFAKTHDEFYYEKNLLFSEYKDIILQKVTGSMLEAIGYGRKFLVNGAEGRQFSLFGRIENNEIDGIDRKILGALLRNGRIRLVDLAGKAKTSIDVVRTRMRKLEEKGIIEKYCATLDYNKLGMEFYKTFLYFDSFSPKDEKKLLELCKDDPNIIHFVRVIAPWDVELEIMVENYARYNKLIERIKEEFPETLRNVESAILSEDYVFPSKKTIFD